MAKNKDLSPEATPNNAGWCERYDDPANECNKPAPLRKGSATPEDWNHLNSDNEGPQDSDD